MAEFRKWVSMIVADIFILTLNLLIIIFDSDQLERKKDVNERAADILKHAIDDEPEKN